MSLSVEHLFLGAILAYLLWRFFTPKSMLAKIPGPPAASWWKGSFYQVYDTHGWKFHQDIVNKYGSVVRLRMLFGDEQLYVTDPLALHNITVKDQYIYEETSTFITTNTVFFGKGLLSTLGDHHRRQRKILNPSFSLSHMRDLLPIFYPVAHELRDILAQQIGKETKELDIMHWVSRAALECIGKGGLGHAFNALHDEKVSQYGATVKKLGPLLFKTNLYRECLPWFVNIGSAEFRRKVVERIPSKVVKEACEVIDTLEKQSIKIYQEKKTAHEKGDEVVRTQVGVEKDIMSVLLRANLAANENDRLPEDELIGQMNTFIVAGQDTTTLILSRIFHLLVLNPDVQTCLREEILAAREEYGSEDFDFDTLMELPYLDAVCRETLRVFPPLSILSRTTKKDVVLPLAWPIPSTDGKTEIREIPLKKDTNVIISIVGANRNKRIWGEDAEEWKPERWLKPLPESVARARLPGVFSSMMTFLSGGRACIGFKFAEIEMKVLLVILLEAFEFTPGPDIDWLMTTVARPVVNNASGETPGLPLKMSLVTNE